MDIENRYHTKGTKKIEFKLKLRIRLETLQEIYYIDTMSKSITDMTQQRS